MDRASCSSEFIFCLLFGAVTSTTIWFPVLSGTRVVILGGLLKIKFYVIVTLCCSGLVFCCFGELSCPDL